MSSYSELKLTEEQKRKFSLAKLSWRNLENGEAKFKEAWSTLMNTVMTTPLQKLALSALQSKFKVIPENFKEGSRYFDNLEAVIHQPETTLSNFSGLIKHRRISSTTYFAICQTCSDILRNSEEVLEVKDPTIKLALEAVKNELDIFRNRVSEAYSEYDRYSYGLINDAEKAFKEQEDKSRNF